MSVDYGRDVSCTDSLHIGRLSSGVRLVGEAAYRRLITPRGALRGGDDEANYGLDVSAYVGKSPRTAEGALPGLIRAELLKDERIDDVTVTLTKTVSGAATSFAIRIDAVTGAGPFRLRLKVSEVTTALVGLEAA